MDVDDPTESYQLSIEEEKSNKDDGMMGTSQENDWNIKGWLKILGKNEKLEYFAKSTKSEGC